MTMKMRAHLTPVLALAVRLAVAAAIMTLTMEAAAPAAGALRERTLIDQGWRFHLGDPAGNTVDLTYADWTRLKEKTENEPADAQAKVESGGTAPARNTIKPWILPTGNAFIKDPARRFVRPEGNPGGGVACVRGDFNDQAWQSVDLPHDWAIAGPFLTSGGGGMGRLPSPGIGWYRKKLDLPAGDAGKSVFLEIDGAMSYATVWLNGHLVGGWPYGYTSWQVELTPYLHFGGQNQLAIRLDNPPDSSRWYPGGGLYRHVWLTKTSPVHVGQWGTQVTTRDVSAASAVIDLTVTIANDSPAAATVKVATQIYALDAAGGRTGEAVASIKPVDVSVAAQAGAGTNGSVTLAHPNLWGPPPAQTPHRYVAVTTVEQDGKAVDSYETRFGVRALRFDPDSGIQVNGERVQLHGVNQHHDLGALGAAFNTRAARRQLELLREMGCNAIRLSHNPPAPELLELTDEMGFLVMDEAFDCWVRGKTPNDYHLIFADWHEQDLRALVRRDRNHSSVILWSVGNEVGEQDTGAEGSAVARELCAIVHEEDPTRHAPARRAGCHQPELSGRGHPPGTGVCGDRSYPHAPAIPRLPCEIPGQGDPQQRDRVRFQQPRRLPVPRFAAGQRAGAGRPGWRLENPPGERLRAPCRRLWRLGGQGVRLPRAASFRRRRVCLDRLGLPGGTHALLFVAQLVFGDHRPRRVQEGPVLPVSGALAAGPAHGASPAALDVAGTRRTSHPGSRVHVRGRS